jgi:hypothetical protein
VLQQHAEGVRNDRLTAWTSCEKDEGGPLGIGFQERVPNQGVSRNWWDVAGIDMTSQGILALGVVNALGIAVDRDGHAQRGDRPRRNGDQPA